MKLQVKVCGMRDPDNIQAISRMPIDLMGFIFYPPSPRYAGELLELSALPENIERVGVFVDAGQEEILQAVERFGLSWLQLHGHETPEQVDAIREASGLGILKAFRIDENFDFNQLEYYEGTCDYFLFDTKGKQMGGTGHVFDWNLLKQYNGGASYFLSGGIGPGMAKQILEIQDTRLAGVDLNSRFETAPGLKDIQQLAAFIQELTALEIPKKDLRCQT